MELFINLTTAAIVAYLFAAMISGLKALSKTDTQDAPVLQIVIATVYGLGWAFRLHTSEAS